MSRRLTPAPDPVKDRLARTGSYIVEGELLLTDYEWSNGTTPDEAQLAKRRREVGIHTAQATPMPTREQQIVQLKTAAPIRARVDQADMSDTPLFGQGSLL